MKKLAIRVIIAAIATLLGYGICSAVPAPHSFPCLQCHASHNSLGEQTQVDNVCLTCHNYSAGARAQGTPFKPGDAAAPYTDPVGTPAAVHSSHAWTGSDTHPAAGAEPPTIPAMVIPRLAGIMSCTKCHNLHGPRSGSENSAPFLRSLNDRDQLCLDCHRSRNRQSHRDGTHPVGIDYGTAFAAATSAFHATPLSANPANPTATLRLAAGTVVCTTCHGVHYTDSSAATFDTHSSGLLGRLIPSAGYLLRTDYRGPAPNTVNTCSSCHKRKMAHNAGGQNIQCTDCHGGHVDERDGSINAWLIRRYMAYSTSSGRIDNRAMGKPTFFVATSALNYRDAAGSGVCQSCHAVPPSGYNPATGKSYPAEHDSLSAGVCSSCHRHDNPLSSFSGSCTSCHGFPPPAAAAGYTTVDENVSPHQRHAGGGSANYSYACSECHQGNSHATGTFQDVFIVRTGTIAGETASYSGADRSCSNLFCHSDGTVVATGVLAPAAILPVWGTTPLTCGGCHGYPPGYANGTPKANSHPQHAFGCNTCHQETSSDGTSITTRERHLNRAFDVAAGPGVSFSYTYAATGGTCNNISCHGTTGAAWGTTLACDTCHGNPPPLAAPGYTTVDEALSPHLKHAGKGTNYSYACSECHKGNRHGTGTFQDVFRNHTGILAGPAATYTPVTRSCSAVYCHSNGTATASGAIPVGTAAWSGGNLACSGCHGYPPVYANGVPKTNSHAKHTFGCDTCHAGTTSTGSTVTDKSLHANGTYNLAPGTGVSFTYAFAATGGTCSSISCHGGSDAVWGAVLACDACHGNPPPRAAFGYSGVDENLSPHRKHASGGANYAYACSECHRGNSHGTGTYQDVFLNHTGILAGPAAGYAAATRSCSAVYCHSDGTAMATGLAPVASVSWSGNLACSSCHGSPPSYATGTPKANSHAKHAFGCATCHAGTTNDSTTIANRSLHVNQAYDLQPGPSVTFSYVYAANGGTCSNISCHGNTSAVWGTTLACDGCHDAPPATASHLTHFGGTVGQAAYGDTKMAQNFGASSDVYIMNCGQCHPVDVARHGNGTVEVELYSAAAPAGSLKARNPANALYTAGAVQLADSKGFPYSNGSCANVYCHSSRSWTTPTGVPNYYPDCAPNPPADLLVTTNYATVTWGGSSLGCAGCHANPPRTRAPENAAAAGDSHSWIAPDTGYGPIEYMHTSNMMPQDWYYPWPDPISCMYCHNDTVKQLNTYYYDSSDPAFPVVMSDVPITNRAKHVNGTNDVAFERDVPVPEITSFSTWKDQRLSNAAYDAGTKTCSNVACHLLRTNVKWGTPYKAMDSQNDCARCHEEGNLCPDRDAARTRQPSISSSPVSTLAAPGYAYSYSVTASEPGGGALTYSLPVAPAGMTISSAGLVTWTPTAGQMGSNPVKVVVSSNASGGLLIAVQEFTVSVVTPQPVITSTAVTTATEWKAYSYRVTATVPTGVPAATYALTTFPAGMTINSSTGIISWTPTSSQVGSFPVTANASAAGYTSTQSFTLTVDPSPITFSFAPVTTGATQVAYSYTATAVKAGGGTIIYSITGKPTWMTFNTSTGAMTGTPSKIQNGSSNITVTATSGGFTQRQIFTLVISPSPITITPPTNLTATRSVLYNPSPNITYSMAGGMTGATYSISSKPAWLTFNTSTGTISGTPPAVTANYTFTVTATNGSSNASKPMTITVP